MSTLILKRRVGESIALGTDIVVTIAEIEGGSVRLGIQAPREVQVERTDNRPRRVRS